MDTFDLAAIQEYNKILYEKEVARIKAEEDLNRLQLSHAQKLASILTTHNNAQKTQRLDIEEQVYADAIKHNRNLNKLKEQQLLQEKSARLHNEADLWYQEQKRTAKKDKDTRQKLQKEYKERKALADKEYNEWYARLNDKEKAEARANKRVEEAARARKNKETAALVNNALQGEQKLTNTLAVMRKADAELGEGAGFSALYKAISDLSKQFSQQIDTIGARKGLIDTRLQGSSNKKRMGSYWDAMSSDITGLAGISPLVKQETIVEKLQTLVNKGISFNVEQRAFLDTISSKIATTFNAADATLLKLVRIQQADTTAARLGMESALTAFLNNMYETTEYMTDAAESIRGNLYAATALMGAESATEFEYQVQKWMGSLYSVGMSQNAVSGLASALGKIAAGDVSAITSGGEGNLMIMAANNAGISIADALQEGLDASKTNQLMAAMVNYLSKIYDESQGSKVIQQQFANIYGITAADLKAAKSLASSTQNIYNQNLNYGGMLSQLNAMASSMYSRTSIGEIMSNTFENLKYTMAAGIANNPVLYALYKSANMLESLVGGMDFSVPLVLGSGSAQTFNIADIMRVGALSGSILSGIGQMISAGSGGGISGLQMLKALGIGSGTSVVTRGTGTGLLSQGPTVEYSESGWIGNESSEDIQRKTMRDTQQDTENQVASAADTSSETTLSTVNSNVEAILQLLEGVVYGSSSIRVDMGDINAWTNAMKGI